MPWEHTGSVPLILNIITMQRWVANFIHQKATWYPMNRRLGGCHSHSGWFGEEKNSCTGTIQTSDYPAYGLVVILTMPPSCYFNITFELKASQTLLCYSSLSETHWQTVPTFCCYIRSPISIILRLEQTKLKVIHQPLNNTFCFRNRLYTRTMKQFIFCSKWLWCEYRQTFSDHILASHWLPAGISLWLLTSLYLGSFTLLFGCGFMDKNPCMYKFLPPAISEYTKH